MMKDLAATIAMLAWTGIGMVALWGIDKNPWWAAGVGWLAIGAYWYVAAVASRLERRAGAAWLLNAETKLGAKLEADPKAVDRWAAEMLAAAKTAEAKTSGQGQGPPDVSPA